jgi:hypothetical protein
MQNCESQGCRPRSGSPTAGVIGNHLKRRRKRNGNQENREKGPRNTKGLRTKGLKKAKKLEATKTLGTDMYLNFPGVGT